MTLNQSEIYMHSHNHHTSNGYIQIQRNKSMSEARGIYAPWPYNFQFNSVAQLCLTLWPHGLQHTRPLCPPPTPGACLNSCPSSQWCHPAISSSVIPFSSRLQSFPATGSFAMSQFSTSGGQRIGASASTSVLPMNIQDWSPLEWTGWISLQSKRLSRVFFNTIVQKHQFFGAQLSLQTSSHIHMWPMEKPQLWLDRPLLAK